MGGRAGRGGAGRGGRTSDGVKFAAKGHSAVLEQI